MALEQISDQIWGSSVRLRVAPGFWLPASMFVVEIVPGELLLYSPHELDDELEEDIRALGEVRWILAPNDYHHMFVGDAASRFDGAKVFGSSGAIKKQKDIEFDGCLDDGPPGDLPESAVVLDIAGMPIVNESVIWLPDDRSLICCDLVLNVQKRKPWLTRMVLGFFLDYDDRPTQGREYRWFFVRDRKQFSESMRDLLGRDFDTLVMAHGKDVCEGGNDALRTAVTWALDEDARSLPA